MFKNTCFVTLVKLFLITAIMPFASLAFLVMSVSNVSLLSSQIPRSFLSCTSQMKINSARFEPYETEQLVMWRVVYGGTKQRSYGI